MSSPTPPPSKQLRLVADQAGQFAGDDRQVALHVIAARADAIRLAPVVRALEQRGTFRQVIVNAVSSETRPATERVLKDVGLDRAHFNLDLPAGSSSEVSAAALLAFERVLHESRPDLVVVSGDTDAALACALAAVKNGVAVGRLESGLRSGDWSSPPEINRVLTDRLADTLFTHGGEASAILQAEGVPATRIHTTGSTAVDTLRRAETYARRRATWRKLELPEHGYILVTLHHADNVGDPERLERTVDGIAALGRHTPVVFPLHPLTQQGLWDSDLLSRFDDAQVRCVPALGYIDFISLASGAGAIATDSSGVQEEATALGVACFALRATTESTITLTHGTNTLLGDDPADLVAVRPARRPPTPCAIPLWDGHAGERVAEALEANHALRGAAAVGG